MTKRIISLLMALMLVIGIFAVPAMAAQDDEGIELYGPMTRCDRCFAAIPTNNTVTWAENGEVLDTCYKSSSLHKHFKSWKCTGLQCPSCGNVIEIAREEKSNDCLGIGRV